MKLAWSILLLAISLAGAPVSAQTCRLNTASSIEIAPGGYDLARATPMVQSIVLRVAGEAGCNFVIGFGGGESARYRQLAGDTDSVGFLLSGSATGDAPLRDLPVAGSAETLRGTLDASGTAQFTIWSIIAPNQRTAPGAKSARVRMTLYRVANSTVLDAADVTFTANVLPMLLAQLEVGGARSSAAGTRRQMDFGEISRGAQAQMGLYIDANVGYTVSLESANRGNLRNRIAPDYLIPYRVGANGQAGTLAAPLRWTEGAGVREHRVSIEIGAVERVLAGTYEDVLTLTISAR